MSIKVSICVPIYKAEKYIRKCLDSLANQTLRDIEVILIDDGSPDSSGVICDEYAARDTRFQVFHQQNSGVAVARQVGLDNAQGEYLIHADPDDWVEPNMYEAMYNKAKDTDADMVVCDFMLEYGDRSVYLSQHPKHGETIDPLAYQLELRMNSGLCNKMIHRKCYKDGAVRFREGMTTSEDFYVLCQLFVNGLSKVEFIPLPLYHYDKSVNPYSISQTTSLAHVGSQKLCIDYLQEHIDVNKYKKGLDIRKKILKTMMWDTPGISRQQLIDTFPEVNSLFADEKGRFGQHSAIYYGLNGYYWMGRAMQAIHQLRNKK